MKKINLTFAEKSNLIVVISFFAALLFFQFCVPEEAHAEVKREGNKFVQVASSGRGASKSTATTFTYVASDGKEYPIFVSANGRAYINKVSGKTGKEYKYYLNEETSRTICKELGIEYKDKASSK